jgi:hypothetical protein
MKKGEIFDCNDFRHYFVYLDDIDRDSFKGIMLTSSGSNIEDNVPLRDNHFKTHDEDGNKYPIPYKKTYFPYVLLAKRSDIVGLMKVGEFTDEGINYIEETIKGLKPIKWAEFIKRQRLSNNEKI